MINKKNSNTFAISEFSDASRRAFENAAHNRSRLARKHSPYRGFANKGAGQDLKVVAGYKRLCKVVRQYIKDSDIPEGVKESLLVGEKFQSEQKGPVAPYSPKDYDKDIVQALKVEDYDIQDEDLEILHQQLRSLVTYIKSEVSYNFSEINVVEEWKNLPNVTVRGYPFHAKGSSVDDDIVKLGGNSLESALKYMLSDDSFLCFPGFRFQGKPYPGPAKLRLVFIPPVHSQYLDNALISYSMRKLKHLPPFAGGLTPEEREAVILSAEKKAQGMNIKRIQLDYSKFDKHIHPKIQVLVASYLNLMDNGTHTELLLKRLEQFKKFRQNQSIVYGDSQERSQITQIKYQLPSGEKRTQHDGTIIGLLLTGYIGQKLFKKQVDWSLTMQLSDDTVLPVPSSYLSEYGYEGTLKKISEVVKKLHFELNPTKAYPNKDMAFLQRLGVPEKGINGVGSFSRALASFLGSENYLRKVPGIVNVWALHLISQITILSEPFSNSPYNLHGVARKIVKDGLSEDEKLVSVLHFLRLQKKLNENEVFKLLVRLAGDSFDHIKKDLGILSYDHKGLGEKLESANFAEIFPILKYLVSANIPIQPEEIMIKNLKFKDQFKRILGYDSEEQVSAEEDVLGNG